MSSQPIDPAEALSYRYRARVAGWGMATAGYSQVFRPEEIDAIPEVFDLARQLGRSVGLRGAGRSYGDASLNTDGLLLDCTGLDRILAFDPEAGIIEVEPGVTVGDVWRTVLPAGWWPPVVPGTMSPTLGGITAANIHGKNNFRVGPLGESIREIDVMLPTGEQLTCSRDVESELFHAVIGGFGLFGIVTRISLQLKHVYSGNLLVEPVVTHSIGDMLRVFAEHETTADYMVGWVDCLARNPQLGRGLIHLAWHLPEGADPNPAASLLPSAQHLPSRLLGLIPPALVPLMARPFVNGNGVALINAAKWHASRLELRGHRYWQTHAAFAFLFDFVPDWKTMYRPGGLIQYQCFVPKEASATVFETILRRCQKADLPSYLGVTKRHRPDRFLLSHAVDGHSFALDFKVTRANKTDLFRLLQGLDALVLDAGGRFYFAKDLTLQADRIARIWPAETLAAARRLKERVDPEHLLQSDLARRLLPEWTGPGTVHLASYGD